MLYTNNNNQQITITIPFTLLNIYAKNGLAVLKLAYYVWINSKSFSLIKSLKFVLGKTADFTTNELIDLLKDLELNPEMAKDYVEDFRQKKEDEKGYSAPNLRL